MFARTPIRRLALAVCLAAWGAVPLLAQDEPGAQLGPAPRVTDPRQLDTTSPRVAGALGPVDPFDRQAVVAFYNAVYQPALAVTNDWNGSTSGCVAGTTSAAYANATMDMVNYYRAMVRLPSALTHNAVKDAKAQAAALMMSANSSLSHSPPTSWACYTTEGREAAGSSNLALGAAGAYAVTLYMNDFGSNNTAVGHRRWVLYPRQTEMGTGSTRNANDLWVIGNFGTRPATPDIVAWPNAGYVPYRLVYARWSFSLNTGSSVSFSGATVTMSRGATSVGLSVLPIANGYGDNTLVWEPSGLSFSAGMADEVITVQVRNVTVAGVARDYTYTVTVIDPGAACAYTATPAAISLPGTAGSGAIQVGTSPSSCGWTAAVSGTSPWITLTGGASGTGPGTVSFNVAANTGPPRTGTIAVAGRTVTVTQAGADTDGDTLPDEWEVQFGLDPGVATGEDGAAGDPDGDGRTNAQELADGTHPRGFHVRYLAEGAVSALFATRLALLNPGTTPALVNVRYLPSTGGPSSVPVAVPGRRRTTVDPAGVLSSGAQFSTIVESDVPIVVDRTMTWDPATGYGAHAETAVMSPHLTWYLAEGSTVGGFSLFYLLQNPNQVEAQVRVRFLRPVGVPLEKTYTLPANSRTNVWVDEEDFAGLGRALASTDVSAVIESLNEQPIIVERAMYLDLPGQVFGAGHESAGVNAPALEWFLAEGATGPFFDLFVLVANPGDTAAQIEATYLLPNGTTIVRPYLVAPNARFNIWVDLEDARLADTAVSTTIRSTNGVPVIVERAMWWPGAAWHEAHNSPGATATGTAWALADGEVGGTRGIETYILVANASDTAAMVEVTLLFEDGAEQAGTFPVLARSRFNVQVAAAFPAAAGRRFGTIVRSLGATPAPIVVERAMYWHAAGQTWAAGTNALGTRLQ